MPLESCMILLDNSEYMRNGDYIPTRLEAQQDAANLLVSHKTQSNPESTVGVMSGSKLLVSPTDDMGKILSALHKIPFDSGEAADVAASVQVASLALKHRRNKNGAQRVVLFLGSPLTHVDSRVLIKAGKWLKKNNVAIDVVALGELKENEPKLKQLVDAANGAVAEGSEGERTCHLVTIPPGVLPSDVLVSSPIIHGGMGGGGTGVEGMDAVGSAGRDVFANFGGVDPNMDPELAMALRVSMEEERARQERVAAAAAARDESKEESDRDGIEVDGNEGATAANNNDEGLMEDSLGDEDALLQQALAMSMAENHVAPSTDDGTPSALEDAEMKENEDEDEENEAMRMALQMSMGDEEETKTEGQQQQHFHDPQFVNQLLGSLPGVDPEDPAIRDALQNLNSAAGPKKDEKKKDDSNK